MCLWLYPDDDQEGDYRKTIERGDFRKVLVERRRVVQGSSAMCQWRFAFI